MRHHFSKHERKFVKKSFARMAPPPFQRCAAIFFPANLSNTFFESFKNFSRQQQKEKNNIFLFLSLNWKKYFCSTVGFSKRALSGFFCKGFNNFPYSFLITPLLKPIWPWQDNSGIFSFMLRSLTFKYIDHQLALPLALSDLHQKEKKTADFPCLWCPI